VAAGVTVTTLRACNVTHESQLHGNDLDLKAKLTITVTDPLLPAGAPADVRSLIVGSPIATWEWAVSHGRCVAPRFSTAGACSARVVRAERFLHRCDSVAWVCCPAPVVTVLCGVLSRWVCCCSVEFSYAPVLVCKAPKRTVGLGDSISASGLLAHLRLHRATTA
jgi:hypothetical protein